MKIVLTNKEMNLLNNMPSEIKSAFKLPAAAKVSQNENEHVIEVDEEYALKMGEEYKTLSYGFFGIGATAGVLIKNFMANVERINKELKEEK